MQYLCTNETFFFFNEKIPSVPSQCFLPFHTVSESAKRRSVRFNLRDLDVSIHNAM